MVNRMDSNENEMLHCCLALTQGHYSWQLDYYRTLMNLEMLKVEYDELVVEKDVFVVVGAVVVDDVQKQFYANEHDDLKTRP